MLNSFFIKQKKLKFLVPLLVFLLVYSCVQDDFQNDFDNNPKNSKTYIIKPLSLE